MVDGAVFAQALAAGFAAGFLDSIVGGGGLILTPAMLNLFPGTPILHLIATQRTSSLLGTAVAAWAYLRVIRVPRKVLAAAALAALLASTLGAMIAQRVDPVVLKWSIIGICVVLAVYTFLAPKLGERESLKFPLAKLALPAGLVGLATGFYNGLIGPGTGTLMVFGFVAVLGFDFLKASATAKVSNVAADLSSWTVLMLAGFVMWPVVLPLVIGNVAGSWIGSRLAILKGSRFIRGVFLLVVCALIARALWELSKA
jgi:hypothetical protein